MPTLNTISVDKLTRLMGTPKAPALIDVRIDEDYALSPMLIPGSRRRTQRRVRAWAEDLNGRGAVVICRQCLNFSQGAAAGRRQSGIPACSLEGGYEAWR